MILQVAGSPPLKECAHDSTPRPAACWCELSHYGHLVCFFFKGKPRGSEWNGMILGFFCSLNFFISDYSMKKLYTWYFWKDIPELFSDFFGRWNLWGFLPLGLIHAKLPILPWPRLIQQGAWRWSLGLLLKVRSWYTAWNQQFASIIAPENGLDPERRSNLPII